MYRAVCFHKILREIILYRITKIMFTSVILFSGHIADLGQILRVKLIAKYVHSIIDVEAVNNFRKIFA